MASLLVVGMHGTEDPTRASFPFHVSKGAVEAGIQAAIVLAGDAVTLMKRAVREGVVGVGVPPLRDLFQFAVDHGVKVYV